MIFVTTGSSELGFNTLISTCDKIANISNYNFYCQIGGSKYIPKHMKWENYLSHNKMLEKIENADIIISHAGFGILSECLRLKKKIIVVPREIESGNSFHSQSSIAEYLDSQGYLFCVKDLSKLEEFINMCYHHEFRIYTTSSKIPLIISNYINSLKK